MLKFAYKNVLKPVLFQRDPERVHDGFIKLGHLLGKSGLARGLVSKLLRYENSALRQEISGIEFPNPVGLSAGFDKDGKLMDILPVVGFGFEQVGTVTYNAYEGNPKPRLTRLKNSEGIVVYYGLKNDGAEVITQRINARKESQMPIGVSIGKTNADYTKEDEAGIKDYVDCLRVVQDTDAGDFFTINVSCPNTFGGEPFTSPAKLERLLTAIAKFDPKKPVFIKMPTDSPWPEFKQLLDIIVKFEFVDGVIISNLIKSRKEADIHPEDQDLADKTTGGISGKPMRRHSTKLISQAYKEYGDKLTIIGVGGIFSAEDAYEKIKAGASLVQLIAGMVFEGPQLIGEINRGLVKMLQTDGFAHISEAIGADHKTS